jgi:hypothetical protein
MFQHWIWNIVVVRHIAFRDISVSDTQVSAFTMLHGYMFWKWADLYTYLLLVTKALLPFSLYLDFLHVLNDHEKFRNPWIAEHMLSSAGRFVNSLRAVIKCARICHLFVYLLVCCTTQYFLFISCVVWYTFITVQFSYIYYLRIYL